VNRWSRIVLSISATATLVWIGAGWLGYRVHDDRSLFVHTMLTFAALLALVLAHAWVATFAVVSVRLLRGTGSFGGAPYARLARQRNVAVGAALAAVAAALSLFTISNARYPAHLSPGSHALAAGLSALVLLGSLFAEARALAGQGRILAEAEP
jgi:uncharacterized membrane protein (UPF0182 family)